MECSKHILVITLQYLLRFAILVIVIIVIASYVRQIVDPYGDVGTFDKEIIDKWEKCYRGQWSTQLFWIHFFQKSF